MSNNPFEQIENRLIGIENLLLDVLIKEKESTPIEQPQHLHSLKSLADFLGWSVVKTQDAKNKDLFPYIQVGRKCIFNTAEILQALKNSKQNRRAKK